MKLKLHRRFKKKNPQISKVMKPRPVGAELFHADGRTDGEPDMTKPIVAVRNFANAPEKRKLQAASK